ncbi:peptidylprolyl isomerase [Paracoccus sp. 11-3]|uniref:Parvulin-like PPIase n=1 Tax=Paracoccus amoyensis TaxID=2760093 RepID=A0A926GCK3_9RHOB|nr:peptidylprolyl isomerase [Paracoccus amoyensis]MBC9246630.1 peptidylprolyl isomerase [Paracoccus amoyensis]
MRHLLSGIAISATLLMGSVTPVLAQNLFEPVIYINDSAVTRYEVQQRQRFMQILGASQTTAKEAQDALVQDRLRTFAGKQMGMEPTDEAIQTGMEEFAGRANLSAAEFVARLEQAGVDVSTFREFIAAGTVWREVIRQRFVGMINVSDAEIDQELKRQIETPILSRVLVSELVIPAPAGQEEQALNLARRISGSNLSENQFAAAAREYSASESAPAGGRLAWMNVDNLPPGLLPVLSSLQPGQVSQPLPVQGAVVLFYMRDTQGTLRPGATDQVIDYLTLRMANTTDAATLAARANSCDDLYVQAGPQVAAQVQRQTMPQGQIPTLIATRLASLDDDEAGFVNYGGSVDLVMLCSRQPALVAEMQNDVATTARPEDGVEAAVPNANALPSREQVRSAIFNRKANAAAEAYLAELRADAIVRRP